MRVQSHEHEPETFCMVLADERSYVRRTLSEGERRRSRSFV
jgi:hypothetical protein